MKYLTLMKNLVDLDQSHYPEIVHKIFVINAPVYFTGMFIAIVILWVAFWSIVKGWLHERVIQKITILSSDYQNTLLEFIDAESLPTVYGGMINISFGFDYFRKVLV